MLQHYAKWKEPDTKATYSTIHSYETPQIGKSHVHWVSDAIQPSHPLFSSFPPEAGS